MENMMETVVFLLENIVSYKSYVVLCRVLKDDIERWERTKSSYISYIFILQSLESVKNDICPEPKLKDSESQMEV